MEEDMDPMDPDAIQVVVEDNEVEQMKKVAKAYGPVVEDGVKYQIGPLPRPAYRPPAIPQLTDRVRRDISTNKLSKEYEPRGVFAKMIQGLRAADFQKFGQIFIGYVPNSRYKWMHKIFERLSNGEKISHADVKFAMTFWMPNNIKNQMRAYLADYVDENIKQLTVDPYNENAISRSGMQPKMSDGELLMVMKNPGITTADMPAWLLEKIKKSLTDRELATVNNAIHNMVLRYEKMAQDRALEKVERHSPVLEAKLARDLDRVESQLTPIIDKLTKISNSSSDATLIDFIDKGMLSWIRKLKDLFDEPEIDMKELMRVVREVRKYNEIVENLYIAALIDPFKVLGARYPTSLPVPTAAFKIRTTVNLRTNDLGVFAFIFNPGYVNTTGFTSLTVNNDVSLTGSAPNANFIGVDIGQGLPADLYSQYRLVSAGVKITTTVSELNSSGILTTGVVYLTSTFDAVVGAATPDTNAAQFGEFSTIDNCYYKQTVPAKSTSPLFMRFIPPDDHYRNFTRVHNDVISGFAFVGYGTGLPASTTIARMEVALNVEAMVSPIFSDYVPSAFYNGSYTDFDEAKAVLTPDMVIVDYNAPKKENSIVPWIDRKWRNDPEMVTLAENSKLALPSRKDKQLGLLAEQLYRILENFDAMRT